MSKNQIDIFLQYLDIETNYAVILNGGYGVGKTHFYKQLLSESIRAKKLPHNNSKQYIPIHISLFGFKTLEEIQEAIFLELYPFLKDKKVKLAAGITKTILRGILKVSNAGNIDNYLGDLTPDANDWLDYKQLVICFDDIDRKSDALDLQDVFGFINSLVENQGAKVLIIANEKQLAKDQNYLQSLKEKVIGVSIQYAPNATEVFEQIINSRYEPAHKEYYGYLKENSSQIVKVVEINESNFRNLIFFLEHFKAIYYSLELLMSKDTDCALNKVDKLTAILNFTLAISFEYKTGALNSQNMNEVPEEVVDAIDNFNIDKFFELNTSTNSEQTDQKPSYYEVFRKKYFNETKFYFFKSIFDYLIGKRAFSIDELKEELGKHFISENNVQPRNQEILGELGYLGCLNLSDKAYKSLTEEMLSFMDLGGYPLSQYPTVFHFTTRFNNILNYNIDRLKQRFKKGINKGISKYKYEPHLDFYITLDNNTEFKDDVSEIIKYCLETNNALLKKKVTVERVDLFDLMLKDFEKFIETISDMGGHYTYTPFWLDYNIKALVKQIHKLKNDQIWRLGHYFNRRYRKHISSQLQSEKKFVIELIKEIDQPASKRSKRNLQNASLNYLVKCLKSCENNFE